MKKHNQSNAADHSKLCFEFHRKLGGGSFAALGL